MQPTTAYVEIQGVALADFRHSTFRVIPQGEEFRAAVLTDPHQASTNVLAMYSAGNFYVQESYLKEITPQSFLAFWEGAIERGSTTFSSQDDKPERRAEVQNENNKYARIIALGVEARTRLAGMDLGDVHKATVEQLENLLK